MRAYQNIKFALCPDVVDIKLDARKSSFGKFPGKSGDFHPYSRSNKRKKMRRYLKRSDKAISKKIFLNLENEYSN